MYRKRSVAAVALTMVLLTACGNETPGTSAPAPSQAEAASPDSASASTAPEATTDAAGSSASPDATASTLDAGVAWEAALDRLGSASTLTYSVKGVFFEGDPEMEMGTTRTFTVDRDAETVHVESRTLAAAGATPDGKAVDVTLIMVISPEGTFLMSPGWAETRPDLAGKWMVMSSEAMRGAGVPPEFSDLSMDPSDYFPPSELVNIGLGSARQEGDKTLISADLPALETLSLMGMNRVLMENPEAAEALTGAMPIDLRIDASGALASAVTTGEAHTLGTGGDPTLEEGVMAMDFASLVITILSVDEPVTIEIPAEEDRATDLSR